MEKPRLTFRPYRSDDLTSPLYSRSFEIDAIAMTREGSVFEARARALNTAATGETYDFDRFPVLRGFLT